LLAGMDDADAMSKLLEKEKSRFAGGELRVGPPHYFCELRGIHVIRGNSVGLSVGPPAAEPAQGGSAELPR